LSPSRETPELYRKYVIANYPRKPVVIVRGQGSYVWDDQGRKYLDLFPGWGVNGIGHCHPRVVQAIQEQAGKLIHADNTYHMEPQADLARLISENSFGGQCFFCNSGAEANEAALKLVRLHTAEGKYKVVTMENSFHGRTLATVTATGQPKYQKGLEPLPSGFVYVPFNDLSAVEDVVDDVTAAVMVEPIQGEGGVNLAEPEFLQGLRKLCDEREVLLILDEVQTGMGRTGRYFGYQHYDVTPDIMTLAKALGGGIAIGALVAKAEIAKSLVPGTHASTFGGNPLACAAAIAVFEAIQEEGLLENARRMGEYTRARLLELQQEFNFIKEARGMGLMIGVELDRPGGDIVRRCLEKGLLINCTHERVLRLMPAMTVKKEEINDGWAILKEAMKEEDN